MRTPVPISGIVGLAASAAAIGLWATEQLSGQMAFEFLTIPFKLVLLAAPLFFVSDLSAFLYQRPRVAVALGWALVAVTLCAMLAYLPWREPFTHHFSNAVYRWYYSDMPSQHPGYYGDFADWQSRWTQRVPHAIEAALVFSYYSIILIACTLRRLGRVGGAVIGVAGYLLLFFVPMFTGLIAWDYDTFLMGIAFDSISMDLFPVYFWHAGDYSIFLYSFMLIFFGVSSVFFFVKPRTPANKLAAPNPAIASQFHAERHWRGIGEPDRSGGQPRMDANGREAGKGDATRVHRRWMATTMHPKGCLAIFIRV